MMPGRDDLTILQQLRSQDKTKQVPVVLLTAKGRSVETTQLAQVNVLEIIKKPFNPTKLANQIEALLDNSCQAKNTLNQTLLPSDS
ncbi:MAG: response regulator [Leptolyngbyaceae cyanobacterium CSU_1_3]|nr:response regulator [Leptolyngbyaceae cyanobacterium CSU_1_3]